MSQVRRELGPVALEALRIRMVDVLPDQIRGCLEELRDEQIWWRLNEHSNSMGIWSDARNRLAAERDICCGDRAKRPTREIDRSSQTGGIIGRCIDMAKRRT